ncbi:hypothetical protein [Bacillus subtilis]|uniref:hypothetical protein n=1 Tax=Bacillus subtilis TaxID=1423 RepID=UPI0039827D68
MPPNEPTMLETLLGSVCEGYETGTFTTATTGGVAAAILVYRLFNNQQQDNFRVMTEELCSRIQKIIHIEFFNQNRNELEALQDGLINYGTHRNYDILDELELKSLELFRKFDNEETIEGVSCAVIASQIHLAVLQAFYNLTPQSPEFERYRSYKQTIIERSRQFSEFMQGKINFVNNAVEHSIDQCMITQDFRCIPYKGNTVGEPLAPYKSCHRNDVDHIFYHGALRDHFNGGANIYYPVRKVKIPVTIDMYNIELRDLERMYPNEEQPKCEVFREEKLGPRKQFALQLTSSMEQSINFFAEIDRYL